MTRKGVTTIPVRPATVEELRPLKRKDFGAEESWDHLIRRLAGLAERTEPVEVPA